ncbi:DNA phosphorothioation-dependent restriction protein DptG [Endozoicomonas arenosclerae]|uniref:DNA phosphorothioation-dependent restriction protein DptG n=1 Tax=Endozoicomonas arenosclerae TaxID=1633495 RepID=UPI0007829F46|nr:DNA phosphorothioation-dependent restriction protein DptG [Endozoicomonas arenosclerae]
MSIISRLVALGEIEQGKIGDNNLSNYLPIRSKKNVLNYDTVAGNVLGLLIGKKLHGFDQNEFEEACLDELSSKLSDTEILDHFKNIYFQNNALLKVSPEFLLLGRQGSESKASGHLSEIFRNFLAQQDHRCEIKSKANFIEKIFWEKMQRYLKPVKQEASNVGPYLPYISDLFAKDIRFLSSKSEYLLSHLESFLELYNFIYCSQLALNIRNFKFDIPEKRPLYFILDTEKASQERTHIQDDGYQHLFSSFGAVFPTLSMLENINKAGKDGKKGRVVPLWQYTQALESEGALNEHSSDNVAEAIECFANNFQEKRKIKSRAAVESTPKDQLTRLFQYALDQFEIKQYDADASRHEIRDAYQKQFVEHIGKHFIQNRGRSGRVLVINQDFLLLLTNIAIGDNRQLRFQELLQEFRQRGVYFDKQSEQALVAFYERVGNVDRMSDSGDAVYVRSTI